MARKKADDKDMSDKNKVLDLALKQIQKEYGEGSIMKLGENQKMNIRAISTGSLNLDIALGIGVVMTLIFNNGGIAGWLPAINLFIFTYFLGMGGAIGIKILIFITTCGWGVYDFSIKNYVGLIFDILTIISCIIGIFRLKKEAGVTKETVVEN